MADEYYNNKIVTTDGDVLMDLTQDTATPEAVLEGETFHLRSGAPATGTYRPSDEIEARLEATVGHSSKNLLENTAETRTINGVTFTVDRQAGTVTANGTATAQATYLVGQIENNSDENVNYYLSGGADEGSEQTYFIIGTSQQGTRLKRWDGTTDMRGTVSSNSNVEMQIAANSIGYIRIFIRKNIECSNLVFKPMVRDGSISDDTFEPYIEPTDRQIETKARAYLTSTVGHSCKNPLDITKYRASSGVTVSTCNPLTGTIQASVSSGTYKSVYILNEDIRYDPNKKYVVSLNCDMANANGLLAIRRRDNNVIVESVSLSTTGSKTLTFRPADYESYGWMISIFITTSAQTTKSINVSALMLREAVIEDDTFEPYCMPIDILMARLDDRITALETASKPTPDPDEGQYYITVYNNTGIDLLYLILTTPQNDGGEFNPGWHSTQSVHKDMLYFGGVFGVLFEAGTSDTVMSITNAGTWNHDFDVDGFLNMCDVKDGSATNYISIHLCADGQIRNKAEYEIYMGI